MKIKRIVAAGMAATMIFGTNMMAFAASWQQNNVGWWYQEDNGTWPANGWKWINGKCYYFNGDGYMLAGTTTPDGYTVNADGAWTVNGVVQMQGYDANYPLKGMTAAVHLETNGRYDFVESGVNGSTSVWAAYNDSFNRYEYFALYVDRLSGKTQDFGELHQSFPEQAARSEATYQVMKDFLNSFDWRNASDRTKVEMAARLVCQSNYVNSGSGIEHMAYGCLVNKEAVCDGFALSFAYLTRLMGMESAYIPNGNHAYNIVKIDGKWYVFDGTDIAVGNETLMVPVDVTIESGNIKVSNFSTRNSGSFVMKLR